MCRKRRMKEEGKFQSKCEECVKFILHLMSIRFPVVMNNSRKETKFSKVEKSSKICDNSRRPLDFLGKSRFKESLLTNSIALKIESTPELMNLSKISSFFEKRCFRLPDVSSPDGKNSDPLFDSWESLIPLSLVPSMHRPFPHFGCHFEWPEILISLNNFQISELHNSIKISFNAKSVVQMRIIRWIFIYKMNSF